MKIFTPLVYCELKELDSNRDVIECVTFAGRNVAGMLFCDRHAKQVLTEMDSSEVELVRQAAGPILAGTIEMERHDAAEAADGDADNR